MNMLFTHHNYSLMKEQVNFKKLSTNFDRSRIFQKDPSEYQLQEM